MQQISEATTISVMFDGSRDAQARRVVSWVQGWDLIVAYFFVRTSCSLRRASSSATAQLGFKMA